MVLNEKMFKSLIRKNKKLKVREIANWEKELDEKVDFGYFTFNINESYLAHIMLIIVYLDNEVEIEIIQAEKDTDELLTVKEKMLELTKDEIRKIKEYNDIEIVDGINKDRFKKYILRNEQLKKKMERYL